MVAAIIFIITSAGCDYQPSISHHPPHVQACMDQTLQAIFLPLHIAIYHSVAEMSASSIPNLFSMRGGRGGRGGFRSRRGGPSTSEAHHESTIQGTDTDAAVSRLSAVDTGYLHDVYAAFFVSRVDGPQRRFPIINRGMSWSLETGGCPSNGAVSQGRIRAQLQSID